MDVEVHDRNALGAMGRLGVTRGNGGVVEKAEAPRHRGFRMVAWRPGGDESVSRPPGHHLVDGENGSAGRSQRGLEGAGRH